MKLIEKHKEWCESGKMTDDGLCASLTNTKYYDTLMLLMPTDKKLFALYVKNKCVGYWGSGLHVDDPKRHFTYTELRQNIVLLICAMHNEL